MALYTGKDIIGKIRSLLFLQFRNSPPTPGSLGLYPAVIPVIDITKRLQDIKILSDTKDVSGAGAVYWYTVPAGIKRTIYGIQKDASTGPSFVHMYDDQGHIFRVFPTATTEAQEFFPSGLDIYPGWYFRYGGTNNGADTAHKLAIIYADEDLT